MKMKALSAALLVAGLLLAPALGQIKISKTAGYGVDLSGLQAEGPQGAIFKRTLQYDLNRSGSFTVVPEGGAYPITGSFSPPASAQIEVRSANFRRSFTGKDGDPRWLAHQVADAMLKEIADAKPFFCSKLILAGKRTGSWELYLCDSDGENLRQITRDRSINLYPAWAPDGKTVVFTSYRRRFPDLYTLDLDTWELNLLAGYNGLNTSGAFSPSGREMALTLSIDNNPELYILRPPVRSGRLFRLTRTPAAAETGASWSPDGKRLVYVADSSGSPQLYILNRETGASSKLAVSGTENVSPSWGPDGRIAFCSRRAGRYRICLYAPESGEVTDLTGDGDNFEDPSWAPDGRHIACTRTSGGGNTIYILDTLGKPSIPLLKVEGSWRSASWSPLLP
jgi:TolB protein